MAQDGKNSDQSPLRVEVGSKRVRAYLGGHVVLDTIEPRLVWEVPKYPHYYVRRDDVVAELAPSGHVRASRRRGPATLFAVRVEGHKAPDAASVFEQAEQAELRELVRVDWNAMDAWFEEDEQVFVHPRDPYRRIDIMPTSRHVHVEVDGQVLADTRRAHAVFETGEPPRYYLAKTDVRTDLFEHSSTVSHCPHKGEAEFWHLRIGRHEYTDAAWSFRHPFPGCTRMAAMVTFDPSVVDVLVDGVKQV